MVQAILRGPRAGQIVRRSFYLDCLLIITLIIVIYSFTLHRHLQAFSTKTLRNSLDTHIRDLNYRGSISISQSLAHGTVTVYSPHWINRLRLNNWVWWPIVILQLWIFTWPIIWFMRRHTPIFVSKIELAHGIPGVSYNLRKSGAALIDALVPGFLQFFGRIGAPGLERPIGRRHLQGFPHDPVAIALLGLHPGFQAVFLQSQ